MTQKVVGHLRAGQRKIWHSLQLAQLSAMLLFIKKSKVKNVMSVH